MRRNSTKDNHPFFPHDFQVLINSGFISLSRLGIPNAVPFLQSGMGESQYSPKQKRVT
jgi:hypothetical protein